MKSKKHKLLFEAFSKLDISLLREAIAYGEDINTVYETEEGFEPFWINDAFSRFPLHSEDWNIAEVIGIWQREKGQIEAFLKEAVNLGMDANFYTMNTVTDICELSA